jgi:CheY-like chemotaxis protein
MREPGPERHSTRLDGIFITAPYREGPPCGGSPARLPDMCQRILVVDDDRKIVGILQLYLEQAGYEVLCAYSDAEALAIARATSPHLIVLDVMLPRGDGLDVCRTLRSYSEPVVIGRARGAFGEVEVKSGQLAGDVVVGGYTIPRPYLSIVPLPPIYPRQPNLGSALLRNFVVTLDQERGRVRLAHSGSPVIELPAPHARMHSAGPDHPTP